MVLLAQPVLSHVEAGEPIANHHVSDTDRAAVATGIGAAPTQDEHPSELCHHPASCQFALLQSDAGTRTPLGDPVRASSESSILHGLRISPPQGPPRL